MDTRLRGLERKAKHDPQARYELGVIRIKNFSLCPGCGKAKADSYKGIGSSDDTCYCCGECFESHYVSGTMIVESCPWRKVRKNGHKETRTRAESF